MKAIEGMQPQINDMERRLGIMQSVEPVLENAIKTLQKVVDVRGMGKKALLQTEAPDDSEAANDHARDTDPVERAKKVERIEHADEGERAILEQQRLEDKANNAAAANRGRADAENDAAADHKDKMTRLGKSLSQVEASDDASSSDSSSSDSD